MFNITCIARSCIERHVKLDLDHDNIMNASRDKKLTSWVMEAMRCNMATVYFSRSLDSRLPRDMQLLRDLYCTKAEELYRKHHRFDQTGGRVLLANFYLRNGRYEMALGVVAKLAPLLDRKLERELHSTGSPHSVCKTSCLISF